MASDHELVGDGMSDMVDDLMRLLVFSQRAKIGGGNGNEMWQQGPAHPEDEQNGSKKFGQLDKEAESKMGQYPQNIEQDPPHDEPALLV